MKNFNSDKVSLKEESFNQEVESSREAEPVVYPLSEEELASVAGGKIKMRYAFDTGD